MRTRVGFKGLLAIAAGALLLLTGCIPAPPTASEPPPDADMVITISNHSYDVSGTVVPGGTIALINLDSVDHTVTSDDGTSFNVPAPGGQTVTFTAPEAAGVYTFHCIPHRSMVSQLEVT